MRNMNARKVVKTNLVLNEDDDIFSYSQPERCWGLLGRANMNRANGSVMARLMAGELIKIQSDYQSYDFSNILPEGDVLTVVQCIDRSSNPHSRYPRTNYIIGMEDVFDEFQVVGAALEECPDLIREICADTRAFYHTFSIPKRDGSRRTIDAPNEDLKRIQKKILRNFLYGAKASRDCHGFMNGKSIKTNAQAHVGKNIVLKMDIRNFFGTISREMVMGAFFEHLPNRKARARGFRVMAELCLLDGFTPQGAPTSPSISNIVLKNLDLILRGICRQRQATYTRYADDLTFSSNNANLPTLIPIIMRHVNDFGFRVNTKKTGVFRKGGRQPVTGITVNEVASVPRAKRMKFRAKLHHILTGRIPREEVNLAEIRGYANFINHINPNQGEKFLGKIAEIETMLAEGEV